LGPLPTANCHWMLDANPPRSAAPDSPSLSREGVGGWVIPTFFSNTASSTCWFPYLSIRQSRRQADPSPDGPTDQHPGNSSVSRKDPPKGFLWDIRIPHPRPAAVPSPHAERGFAERRGEVPPPNRRFFYPRIFLGKNTASSTCWFPYLSIRQPSGRSSTDQHPGNSSV